MITVCHTGQLQYGNAGCIAIGMVVAGGPFVHLYNIRQGLDGYSLPA